MKYGKVPVDKVGYPRGYSELTGIKKMIMRKDSLPLRNAADFYAIPLEVNYTLTEELLAASIDKKLAKQSGWFCPDLNLVMFKDGLATISNKSGKASFNLFIKVEPEKLHVACNCGTSVATICIHTFKALNRMIVYDDMDNFKKFMPDDSVQLVFNNRKYFQTAPGLQNMFKPKSALGSVYGLTEIVGYKIEDVLTLPARMPVEIEPRETSMCYFIMNSRSNDFLPFLLPCLGKFNKAGNHIKNFGRFLSGIEKEHDHLLTEDQRTLNSICLSLYKQVEHLPHRLIHDKSHNNAASLCEAFNGWQKALPLLEQQHIFTHPYVTRSHLKGKPSLSCAEKVTISKSRPFIEFKLTDKGSFYQLDMKMLINKKAITNYAMLDTFLVRDGDTVYMFSCLRDAGISEWMEKSKRRLTIFKEQFVVFEKDFLQPLEKYYLVRKKALK